MKEKKQKQTAEVAAETQTAKSGKKSFLQLILFIALSLAGFVVQMVIEQVGGRIDAIKNLQINGTTDFDFFGIPNTYGAFIVSLVAIFICKVINFILHRKVLFKPRRNLAFGIAMYVLFSVVLWFGSAIIKAPVQNALMNWSFWTDNIKSDPEGWALTLAVMVYSTADLIIMFFAEKFLIMNDKLFSKKNKEQVAVATEGAVAENAVAADVVAEEANKASEEVVSETVEEKAEETAQPVEEVATEEKIGRAHV